MLGPPGLEEELIAEIRQAATVGVRGTWWRGRCFPRGFAPRVADFAPAHEAGRFHRRGEEALYFGRTLRAVLAECEGRPDRPALWVQRFDLDLPRVRVLARPRGNGGRVLRGAWASADERASARDDYALSHVLADAARKAGVEAILYDSDESPEDGDVNLALLGAAVRAACRMAVGEPHAEG